MTLTQKEYIGFNVITSLGSILEDFSADKIFLVRGKASYSKCGAKKYLEQFLTDCRVVSFFEFDQNPKVEDLNRGIKAYRGADSDIVVAVGGGSVIDMAKMINFFGCNQLEPERYFAQENSDVKPVKPLIAIPTTSGSGAEATRSAVLYINHKKHSVSHDYILPAAAIVDPGLTLSLPGKLTAVSGMDALSQAIESYWSIHSNQESKRFCREAISLIMGNLVTAVKCPNDDARLGMSRAAHLAGKAINITKTTAAHAVSYPLTSFFGVPHGHAVGLILPSLLSYNYEVTVGDVSDSRGVDYVKETIREIAALLELNSVESAKQMLDNIMCEIGLETKLSSLGIKSKSDIELIIENGFTPDRVSNNPRRLTEDSLRKILYGIATPRGVQK